MSELWSLPARVTAKSEARDILPLHCLLRRGGCDCWMQDGDLLLCHRVCRAVVRAGGVECVYSRWTCQPSKLVTPGSFVASFRAAWVLVLGFLPVAEWHDRERSVARYCDLLLDIAVDCNGDDLVLLQHSFVDVRTLSDSYCLERRFNAPSRTRSTIQRNKMALSTTATDTSLVSVAVVDNAILFRWIVFRG